MLEVSLDELVGREKPSPPRIHNPKLRELYEQVDYLEDEDQQALIVLLDSLLKRSQVAKVLSR